MILNCCKYRFSVYQLLVAFGTVVLVSISCWDNPWEASETTAHANEEPCPLVGITMACCFGHHSFITSITMHVSWNRIPINTR